MKWSCAVLEVVRTYFRHPKWIIHISPCVGVKQTLHYCSLNHWFNAEVVKDMQCNLRISLKKIFKQIRGCALSSLWLHCMHKMCPFFINEGWFHGFLVLKRTREVGVGYWTEWVTNLQTTRWWVDGTALLPSSRIWQVAAVENLCNQCVLGYKSMTMSLFTCVESNAPTDLVQNLNTLWIVSQ